MSRFMNRIKGTCSGSGRSRKKYKGMLLLRVALLKKSYFLMVVSVIKSITKRGSETCLHLIGLCNGFPTDL